MQNLPPDILREIARRVGLRNRTALDATSRTMRAAVRPVTAEITRETREALCRALKIAFGIRKVMQQFVDPTIPSRVNPQKRIAFSKAIEAYISTAKARARPGEGAELTSRVTMDSYDTACYVTCLFGGYINGSRIDVHATIRPPFVNFNVQCYGLSQKIAVTKKGVAHLRETRNSAARVKQAIRRMSRVATDRDATRRDAGEAAAPPAAPGLGLGAAFLSMARQEAHKAELRKLKMRLQQANYDRPETIAIKVATRAIKACATSLRATMW